MINGQKLNRPSEVIYQIYPASFKDSNEDGIGDLRGITRGLDHVKSLGVDAIWISPFFLSPEGKAGDGGYAITDYRTIDPRFSSMTESEGTPEERSARAMEDFRELLAEAHKRGLRVYTDFVLCHSSHEHAWFRASHDTSHPEHEKYKDYYVWADGKNGGGLPNNWQSVFNDQPAWTWDDSRKQYFLHHFNTTQPALNLNNSAVQDAVVQEMQFWLDMGVDGLRLDALPYANYHKDLIDNTQKGFCNDAGWEKRWVSQDFTGSMCQPQTENELVPKLRRMKDAYLREGRRVTLVGEAIAGPWGGQGDMMQAAKYLDPHTGVDSCYTNAFVQLFWDKYPSADRVKKMLAEIVEHSPDGGLCNTLGNHDFPRFTSRMKGAANPALYRTITKQLMALAVTLPGSFCLYQGDELGLTQANRDDMQGKIQDLLPHGKGNRDGCRTPMPWKYNDKNAGFSGSDDPYLPVPACHKVLAVDMQESQGESMLNFTRRILQQRQENPALAQGKLEILKAPDPIVAFVRRTDEQTVLCAFNMSDRQVSFRPDPKAVAGLNLPGSGEVVLEAYDSSFYGLYPPVKGVETGIGPARALSRVAAPVPRSNGHRKKPRELFAADMLITDNHVPEQAVREFLGRVKEIDPEIEIGEKSTVSKQVSDEIFALTDAYLGRDFERITAGGSTSCTLRTVKEMLGDNITVNLLGLAGNDKYGKAIRRFLKSAGINLLVDRWPAEVTPAETAVSHIIKHGDGRNTVLTYSGTEIEAFKKVLEKDRDLLRNSIARCDVVYLPESTMSKFGLPFTQDILEYRWKEKKELVLSLPTHASFGPTDRKKFRDWIPSCNVVMGNDVEFCRIFDGETPREQITQEQMDRVVAALQAGFQLEVLKKEGRPCSEHGQVAFITCGGNKPALLVTKDKAIPIPVAQVKEIKNTLGAGHAAFAGFLAGYMKGLDHETSAHLAMGMAAEKIQKENLHPYLISPQQSVGRVALRSGPIGEAARMFRTNAVAEAEALSLV